MGISDENAEQDRQAAKTLRELRKKKREKRPANLDSTVATLGTKPVVD